MPSQTHPPPLSQLSDRVREVRDRLLAFEHAHRAWLDAVHPDHRDSARNLLHYVALRSEDLRGLQDELSRWGLSSLGRCEAHVLPTVESVLALTRTLAGAVPEQPPRVEEARALDAALPRNAERLFGPEPARRGTRIMVTLAAADAATPGVFEDLVAAGMDCVRINTGHDEAQVWRALAERVRAVRTRAGVMPRILVDLGGPKIRTTGLGTRRSVVRWKVARDTSGLVVRPARVLLRAAEAPEPKGDTVPDAVLPMPEDWPSRLRVGDTVRFDDAWGRRRALQVVSLDPSGAWCEARRSARVAEGGDVTLRRAGKTVARGRWQNLPEEPVKVRVRAGESLELLRGRDEGADAERDAEGHVIRPARFGCTLPKALDNVRDGMRVRFDDGRVEARVRRADARGLELLVTRTEPGGSNLGADKGINVPDADVEIPAPTKEDLAVLADVVACADMVGLSFVQHPGDIRRLRAALARRGAAALPLVLKIETRRAFENLPVLLLEALRGPVAGVMIARGDLAVHVGWERLAELQEEILWLCEAAHVPAIWATQVLEGVARSGMPSRAEITDAAMGQRAECVMLNKGSYVLEAVRMLDGILVRMQEHQRKKVSRFRRLAVSRLPIPEHAPRRRDRRPTKAHTQRVR